MNEIKTFDIYSVTFAQQTGSIQSGKRPCLVVQNNKGNAFAPTVVVVPLTTQLKKIGQPTHHIIHRSKSNGLRCDSMVLAEQVVTVDKRALGEYIGSVASTYDQERIAAAFMANITGHNKFKEALNDKQRRAE